MNIEQVRLLIEARAGIVTFSVDEGQPDPDQARLDELAELARDGYVTDYNLIECGEMAEVSLTDKGRAFLSSLVPGTPTEKAERVASELAGLVEDFHDAGDATSTINGCHRRHGACFTLLTTLGEFEVEVKERR